MFKPSDESTKTESLLNRFQQPLRNVQDSCPGTGCYSFMFCNIWKRYCDLLKAKYGSDKEKSKKLKGPDESLSEELKRALTSRGMRMALLLGIGLSHR